jgi:formylglycine-generating enzyme required for sulfatase activity
MHPDMFRAQGGRAKYTPAYDALVRYVRRVGIEDEVNLLTPGEYFAANSELLQLLRKGHYGVQLDRESLERLATWIDLNAPCHGTWQDVFPIPDRMQERRGELARLTGGPDESLPPSSVLAPRADEPIAAIGSPPPAAVIPAETRDNGPPMPQVRGPLNEAKLELDLGDGVRLELTHVPAGTIVMGSPTGPADEQPPAPVVIEQPFWIGTHEITNRQFQQFDREFDAGFYVKRHASADDRGLPLNDPQQPAVRVSWYQALRFCDWLSQKTGHHCSLPTEAEWEWACRAGSAEAFSFGAEQTDFSVWANLADGCFARGFLPDGKQITGGVDHLLLEGADLAASQWQDRHIVTAFVGSYRPNAWGLYDLHGNAAEWTLSTYAAYPYRDADGRNDPLAAGDRVVRGGSFCDRPARSQAGYRLPYRPWQRPFNVGFRIVCTGATCSR